MARQAKAPDPGPPVARRTDAITAAILTGAGWVEVYPFHGTTGWRHERPGMEPETLTEDEALKRVESERKGA